MGRGGCSPVARAGPARAWGGGGGGGGGGGWGWWAARRCRGRRRRGLGGESRCVVGCRCRCDRRRFRSRALAVYPRCCEAREEAQEIAGRHGRQRRDGGGCEGDRRCGRGHYPRR